MKTLFALGNPEPEYEGTLHNAGKLFLNHFLTEALKMDATFEQKPRLHAALHKSPDMLLAKSLTYMNNSGQAAKALVEYYSLNLPDFFLVHDDLDLSFGEYKIQFASSPKGHNGVLSVEQYLKTDQFYRVRIGIDAREGSKAIPPKQYVLSHFTQEQREQLKNVFDAIGREVLAHFDSF